METAFWTCHSSIDGANYVRIFVTDFPIRNIRTLTVGVNLDDTVAEVRDAILRKLGLERADFGLVYGSKVLTDTNATLSEYGVESDCTLRCVSFRPNRFSPGHWVKTYNVTILTSDQSRVTLKLMTDIQYPISLIKVAFLREYNRVVKNASKVNDAAHVTLLSKTRGLLLDGDSLPDQKRDGQEDSGYHSMRLPEYEFEPERLARQNADTTLIAWICKSKGVSDRLQKELSYLGTSAQSEFVTRLSTLTEDGNEVDSLRAGLPSLDTSKPKRERNRIIEKTRRFFGFRRNNPNRS